MVLSAACQSNGAMLVVDATIGEHAIDRTIELSSP